MTVVADAGPLIALAKVGGLDVLFRLHPHVSMPPAVHDEAIRMGRERRAPDAQLLEEALQAGRLRLVVPGPSPLPVSAQLGRGEEEVILAAIEIKAEWVLMDDSSARQAATRCFQTAHVSTGVKGTLGVIVSAFHAGLLPVEEAIDLVTRLSDRPDVWIHSRLCQQVTETLRRAN